MALAGLTIAAGGWMTNLIVYLIEQYNIKSIQATKISNVIYGSTSLLPIAGAILADSLLGNFIVVSFSSFISLLVNIPYLIINYTLAFISSKKLFTWYYAQGLVLLTLTATLHSLRPAHCMEGSETCEAPTHFQYTVLYSAIILLSIGMGGTRFTIATMGADQLDKAKDQGTFFNWFFFTLYSSMAVGITVIVYVENDVSWGLGFGLCLVINAIGLAIFISGKGYYRYVKPRGSPFMSLARVIVAAIKKKKVPVPSESKNYYYGDISETKSAGPGPTPSFR